MDPDSSHRGDGAGAEQLPPTPDRRLTGQLFGYLIVRTRLPLVLLLGDGRTAGAAGSPPRPVSRQVVREGTSSRRRHALTRQRRRVDRGHLQGSTRPDPEGYALCQQHRQGSGVRSPLVGSARRRLPIPEACVGCCTNEPYPVSDLPPLICPLPSVRRWSPPSWVVAGAAFRRGWHRTQPTAPQCCSPGLTGGAPVPAASAGAAGKR